MHAIAGLIITAAVGINLFDVKKDSASDYQPYVWLFLLCSVFDSASHALKESIVRSQPLDQEEFSFKISISQFVVGLLLAPAIIYFSQQEINYDGSRLAEFKP